MAIASETGQAGRGNNEEFGLLSLEFDENFCMGGPGIIMSRQTLKRGKKLRLKLILGFKMISSSRTTHSYMSEESVQYTRRRGGGEVRAKICRHSLYVEL